MLSDLVVFGLRRHGAEQLKLSDPGEFETFRLKDTTTHSEYSWEYAVNGLVFARSLPGACTLSCMVFCCKDSAHPRALRMLHKPTPTNGRSMPATSHMSDLRAFQAVALLPTATAVAVPSRIQVAVPELAGYGSGSG